MAESAHEQPVQAKKGLEASEVAKHNSREDCWIIIGNAKNGGPKVFDVTSFLDDHPGGGDVILDLAGKNVDDMFEDIGHSSDARKLMSKFLIGELILDPQELEKLKQVATDKKEQSKRGGLNVLVVVLLLIAVAIGVYLKQ